MEIVDYLRIARHRLWILILVPLLAAGGTAAYELKQPKQYQTTVTVAAPALIGGSTSQTFSGANAVQSFVNNFEAATTTPKVVSEVAAQTRVQPGVITAGLTTAQIGSSNQVSLVYTTQNPKLAGPVATTDARDALNFLFGTQVRLAEQSLANARHQLATVQAQIAAMEAKANIVETPDRAAELLSQQIASLQQQQLQLQAGGNAAGAAAVGSTIAGKQQQLSALASLVRTYQPLAAQETGALNLVQTQNQNLQTTLEQQAAAAPTTAMHVSQTHPASRLSPMLKKVIPAGAAGLFLAIVLVLVTEALRSRRRQTTQGIPSDTVVTMPTAAGAEGAVLNSTSA